MNDQDLDCWGAAKWIIDTIKDEPGVLEESYHFEDAVLILLELGLKAADDGGTNAKRMSALPLPVWWLKRLPGGERIA